MSSSEGLPSAGLAPDVGPHAAPDAMSTHAVPVDAVPALSAERIEARVAALDSADALSLPEQVELYQRLHGELQSALAEIDNP